MPLLEAILGIYGAAATAASGLKDLKEVLADRVVLEDVLAKLVAEGFQPQVPRLAHLCPDGSPTFDSGAFARKLAEAELPHSIEELTTAILPILASCVSTPGATCPDDDLVPVYDCILRSALRGMWKHIGRYGALANEILLCQEEQTQGLIKGGVEQVRGDITEVRGDLAAVSEEMASLAQFARQVLQRVHDDLLDTAPPTEHTIDDERYRNPFILVRSEDFNHNYDRLARLFQNSPEWDSIQRRSDNVFIEGGRGTGKSMLLRRLTAEASVAAMRINNHEAMFDDIKDDYFGVYVKLTRGYYDQLGAVGSVGSDVMDLLAQHELNIEVCAAFVATLRWLASTRSLSLEFERMGALIAGIGGLFPNAQAPRTLDDLEHTIRFEQDQITAYYRNRAFGHQTDYRGSASETVSFMRRLSTLFRTHLFPDREMRLFLLIDEFESLLHVQQMAVNTVIKMRLPDVSVKVGVRTDGRKTADTFTAGDPIQQPRDYTVVTLDYDPASDEYSQLLQGIASRRLAEAGYADTDIRHYLLPQHHTQEVSPEALDAELRAIWGSGTRRGAVACPDEMPEEFRRKYCVAAVFRILARTHRRKAYCGFDQYALLSSGVISNFIELCKYAFYFAFSDEIPLGRASTVPSYLQTDAAYAVSERLLKTIDGNVPEVGPQLAQLVFDLGALLRNRLLNHSSEPEANRLVIQDYQAIESGGMLLGKVIHQAAIWSVLHVHQGADAIRPKDSARLPGIEVVINRIYCPALGISPRARWRVPVRAAELEHLLQHATRDAAYGQLLRTVGGMGKKRNEHPTLFHLEGEDS